MRIVSYNVRALQDDYQALVRVIRALHPDVLCLQEVPRWTVTGNAIARLARDTGLLWGGRRGRAGQNDILTSPTVITGTITHHRLPVRDWKDTRGFVQAEVQEPGGPWLSVHAIHLSLNPAERLQHVNTIMGTPARGLRVIAGDINEGPGAPAWDALAGSLRLATPTAATFPAKAPGMLLDAIFVEQGLSVAQASLAAEDCAPDDADLTCATDHRPVWADLTWS